MRSVFTALVLFIAACFSSASFAQGELQFDEPVPEIDALVEDCFDQKGVAFLPDTDVICYNAAIFPEEFLKLNTLGPASRIIITSPGGNVLTARGMTTILDERAEPVTIAGMCMSACAMVILPALDDIHIHRTALIAVHGITMMPFKRWWGWHKNDEKPSVFAILRAQNGYDFGFAMHSSLTSHMRGHLNAQNIDIGYIQEVSDAMEDDARAWTACRVDPKNYWGIITPEHAKKYLGDALTRIEPFVTNWSDPQNRKYRGWGHNIAERTFILNNDFKEGNCGD